MKKLNKTKVVVISILTFAFLLSVVLLGISTVQNQATQDSSAAICASEHSTDCINPPPQGSCSKANSQYNVTCAGKNESSCKATSWNLNYADCCVVVGANLSCTDRPNRPSYCSLISCSNANPAFNCGGTKIYDPACSWSGSSGSGGGQTSGGGTDTPDNSGNGGGEQSGGGNGPSTPSCTPIKPAVAKLTGPRNKTEITESKVSISWEKGGSFGKECRDNGKPNRFILKYAVVGANQNCPVIGSKYKGRQLVEKLPNQKQYSVEIAELKNNKKYCWFIRTKNGETKSETKVRSFVTNIATPAPDKTEETLKITEGGTTIDIVDNAE